MVGIIFIVSSLSIREIIFLKLHCYQRFSSRGKKVIQKIKDCYKLLWFLLIVVLIRSSSLVLSESRWTLGSRLWTISIRAILFQSFESSPSSCLESWFTVYLQNHFFNSTFNSFIQWIKIIFSKKWLYS
jgi:hypothetical protein